MEVPNKWRGKSMNTGGIVEGLLISRHSRHYLPVILDAWGREHQIQPDKLFKLAGYDENGNEVYKSWRNGK